METITIPKGFKVTPEQFEQLAYAEQLARMELTKDGDLIVMSPTGGEASRKNFNLYLGLAEKVRQHISMITS
jgi:Uma2 family endonuclease